MGEIRFVGTDETRGYPYPVCKQERSFLYELRAYLVFVKVGECYILAASFPSLVSVSV